MSTDNNSAAQPGETAPIQGQSPVKSIANSFSKRVIMPTVLTTTVAVNAIIGAAAGFFATRSTVYRPIPGESAPYQFGREMVRSYKDIWAGIGTGVWDYVTGNEEPLPPEAPIVYQPKVPGSPSTLPTPDEVRQFFRELEKLGPTPEERQKFIDQLKKQLPTSEEMEELFRELEKLDSTLGSPMPMGPT